MARSKSNGNEDSSANLGFEAKLWLAADKLRNNMDAAEYKHVIVGTYHAWCGEPQTLGCRLDAYADIPGFCKSATTAEIAAHEKMARLVQELDVQFQESATLERQIRHNLTGLGYGI